MECPLDERYQGKCIVLKFSIKWRRKLKKTYVGSTQDDFKKV